MIDESILPVHLKNARKMLPNVPQDMFDMFFVTLIEDVGWPFKDKSDSAECTDWQRIFSPFTLKQIVDFEWKRKAFIFNRAMFWRESFDDVEAVVKNFFGLLPRFGKYDYERCRRSTEYHLGRIVGGNGLDVPVVLAPITDFGQIYKILDGNHRIAAVLLYETMTHRKVNFSAWVGSNKVPVRDNYGVEGCDMQWPEEGIDMMSQNP